MDKVLHTKWGTAKIDSSGYYRITSRKENNHHKLLHRLIYEDFWGVSIPPQIHIHHKDENILNNCILNLEAIGMSEHISQHKMGKNNPNYGNKFSLDESKLKSKQTSSTNIFRVYKQKSKSCKQGFIWCYQYYEEGSKKSIRRTNLEDLKEEVINNNLEWCEFA